MYPLPSLNGLRFFEAVARHMSFKEAARELFVTPGAVSQQIRHLEEELEVTLFRRNGRQVQLTEAGLQLFPALRESFLRITQVIDQLKALDSTGALTISVLPSFASKWLVPRLDRFAERHPEIDIRISASRDLVDFSKADVDLAIRLGGKKAPGLERYLLMEEESYPICSPALLKGRHPLREPADLLRHPLLHDENTKDWESWLKKLGLPADAAKKGPVFDDAGLMVQAAILGQGVALGRRSLVAADLEAGHLVRLFSLAEPFYYGNYYIVYPREFAHRSKLTAFRDWLLKEAGNTLPMNPFDEGAL